MEDITPYLKDDSKTTNIRNSLSLMGRTEEQIIEIDKVALDNHLYRPTRSERIPTFRTLVTQIESRRPSRTITINDLILLKRKENAKDYTTNVLQRLNNNIEPSLATNKYDSDEDNVRRTRRKRLPC